MLKNDLTMLARSIDDVVELYGIDRFKRIGDSAGTVLDFGQKMYKFLCVATFQSKNAMKYLQVVYDIGHVYTSIYKCIESRVV